MANGRNDAQEAEVGSGPNVSADRPIETEEEDRFGVTDFAHAVADALAGMKAPYGTVLGLQGPWGSGKSGVVNLMRARLQKIAGDVEIVSFNPWWFSKVDDLAPVFFGEVAAALPENGTAAVKSKLRTVGARLGRHAGLLGGAIDAISSGATGGLAASGMAALAEFISPERSVSEVHADLADALKKQNRRILVIIDDLDRLDAAQALEMLKLVKSAGQLPNVMYLLVYDRIILDRALAKLAPAEAPQYLEKIVQVSFTLPPILAEDLRGWLFSAFDKVFGVAEFGPETHCHNLFESLVSPTVKSPRDAVRLVNVLSAAWPAIAKAANAADLIAIETLRLFHPAVHEAVQRHRSVVLGAEKMFGFGDDSSAALDEMLLVGVPKRRLTDLRYGLAQLFPILAGPWENSEVGSDRADEWRRDRRICSEAYFDVYFRLSGAQQGAALRQVNHLLEVAGDHWKVTTLLRTAAATERPQGGTMAAVLLEEIKARADVIDEALIPDLVVSLFEVADDLMVSEDESWGFIRENNKLRLHWLLNRLVGDRFPEQQRGEIFTNALSSAALGWTTDFVNRCVKQYDDKDSRSGPPLVSQTCAHDMQERALDRLEQAANDGNLLDAPNLTGVLSQWLYLGKGTRDERVKDWVESQLGDVRALAHFAECFVGQVRTEASGDRVAVTRDVVQPDRLGWLVDPEDFIRRVEEAVGELPADDASRAKLERFQRAVTLGKKDGW